MAKPIIGLLVVATIAFAWEWRSARTELEVLEKRAAALEAEPGAATSETTAVPMTEAQQAAYVLAQLAQEDAGNDIAELRAQVATLRRKVERAESAQRRAEKARSMSNDERQKLLRERQALIDESQQLREAAAAIAAELMRAHAELEKAKGRR